MGSTGPPAGREAPGRPRCVVHSHAWPVMLLLLAAVTVVAAALWTDVDVAGAAGSAVGAAVGAAIIGLAAGVPGARAVRGRPSVRAAEDVELRGSTWPLVSGALWWVAVALFVGLVYGDLVTMGIIGVVIGVAGNLDARVVRRWEVEHHARLAWARRSRRERWRHPLRTSHAIGVSTS